jgi:predicted RNA-binding Zn-ribbon protein involved in translation (DUF1610 family)
MNDETVGPCPVCKREARGGLEKLGTSVVCPACGSYWISKLATARTDNLSDKDRAALSSGIRARSDAGEKVRIESGDIDRLVSEGLSRKE